MRTIALKVIIASLISVCSFLLVSCERDFPEMDFKLPDETQKGANTFGFMFKNKPWVNYGEYCAALIYCSENLGYGLNYDKRTSQMGFGSNAYKFVREKKEVKTHQSFGFNLDSISGPNKYFIKSNAGRSSVTFTDRNYDVYYEPVPNRKPFEVEITKLDTIAKIVSGRFNGVLFNKLNLKDSVIIENGRFDFLTGVFYYN